MPMQSDWYARARAILNREWDPIGHCPDDEYDDYRNQIAALIEAGVSDDGLLTYLEWAEVAFIGLSPPVDRERNAKVVAALRALGSPPRCAE
jgi:hypothetical protein